MSELCRCGQAAAITLTVNGIAVARCEACWQKFLRQLKKRNQRAAKLKRGAGKPAPGRRKP